VFLIVLQCNICILIVLVYAVHEAPNDFVHSHSIQQQQNDMDELLNVAYYSLTVGLASLVEAIDTPNQSV